MLAMIPGVNQCRLASTRIIATTKPPNLRAPLVRRTSGPAQEQHGTAQSSNERQEGPPSPKANRPRSLARWAHLARHPIEPSPLMSTPTSSTVPLKLPPPPAQINLRSRSIAVAPIGSMKRPSIAFFSCPTLYRLGVEFLRAAREMFGIRVFRTTRGSSFWSVDVIVLDEEVGPLDLEGYMTASQAQRHRRAMIRRVDRYAKKRLTSLNPTTAEQSFKSSVRDAHGSPSPSGRPSRHLTEQYLRMSQENHSKQLPSTTIYSSFEEKGSSILSPENDDPISSASPNSPSTPQIPDPLMDKLPRRGPLSIKLHHPQFMRLRSEKGIEPLSHKSRLNHWTTLYGNLPTYHPHFAATARAMADVVTECNAILTAWKRYMLAENGFALIRIAGPQHGMYVPKPCVLVPGWVKRKVSGHEYGMIVRFLCEFALEQWPRRRLAEMAEREQERVQELFLLPDVKLVNNPFRWAQLWEMETMLKKWKMERVVEEWGAKRAAEAGLDWNDENGVAKDIDSRWK